MFLEIHSCKEFLSYSVVGGFGGNYHLIERPLLINLAYIKTIEFNEIEVNEEIEACFKYSDMDLKEEISRQEGTRTGSCAIIITARDFKPPHRQHTKKSRKIRIKFIHLASMDDGYEIYFRPGTDEYEKMKELIYSQVCNPSFHGSPFDIGIEPTNDDDDDDD